MLSVNGRDAQVRYTVNGVTHQGTGTVYKNTVMFDGAQISSDDGKTGHVIFRDRHQSLSVPVTKLQTSNSTSSVNKLV